MILELSGNPVAVLENVTESQDIAVQPGAVWELPERARAYLLDLLQGGGVNLHVEYVNLLYRTLHDLGEAPRTSFGDSGRNLSGVALNIELDPLLKKVQRKRQLRPLSLPCGLGAAAADRPQPAGYGRDASRGGGHPLAAPRRGRGGRRGPRGRVRALAPGGAAAGRAVASIGVRRQVNVPLVIIRVERAANRLIAPRLWPANARSRNRRHPRAGRARPYVAPSWAGAGQSAPGG